MDKLPQALLVKLVIYLGLALAFPSYIQAITIAEQKPAFEDNLDTWQVIQELGTNLSGTLVVGQFDFDLV